MIRVERDLNTFEAQIGVFNWRNLKRVDWLLLATVVLLAVVGMIVLSSGSDSQQNHYTQSRNLLVGLAAAILIVCIDYRALISLAPVTLGVVAVMLLLVKVIGVEAKGGQHWLPILPGLRLQPSELSKLALCYALAWYLSRIGSRIENIFYFLLCFAISGLVIGLVLIQGDLGTAITIIPLAFVMPYAAGCKKRYLAGLLVLGTIGAVTLWVVDEKLELGLIKEYQRGRIYSFMDPESDPRGDGFQIIHAKLAVGSGQMWGKGYKQGTHTEYGYVLEQNTDFIFARLAEEFGFAGGVGVLGLFAVFLLRGLSLARSCPDPAGSLLALGCVTVLAVHIIVNIAIVLHLMPITGIPLPFISYGGSFYLTTMMCVGAILSVHVRKGLFD
ncbi:MAG: rod shape-determining protein RodA [Candidatus Hydrogenedentota bacterium]